MNYDTVTQNNSQVPLDTMAPGDLFVIVSSPSQNLNGTVAVVSVNDSASILDLNIAQNIKKSDIPGTVVERLPSGSVVTLKVK